MKKILLLLSLFVVAVACDSDDNAQNITSNTGSLTAIIGGETTVFTGNTVNTCLGDCSISDVNTFFNLNAEDSDGQFFGFVVINAAVGTFDLGTANSTDEDLACASFAYLRDPADNAEDADAFYTSFADIGGSGTVEISKFDSETKLASGSFEFVVRTPGVDGEEITINNGTFTDVAIQPLQNCTVTIF